LGYNSNSPVRLRFASFELDIETGELRKHGRPVRLQPQPSRVLAALISRPGELVTRQELRHQIWDGTTFVDFEQGLNFCIRQIRLVLDDDAESPHFIETVPSPRVPLHCGYHGSERNTNRTRTSPEEKVDRCCVCSPHA